MSAFITEWLMTDGNFTLPLRSGYTYNMTVDWGDESDPVTVTAYNDANATHTYVSGTYQISITGTCGAFYINNGSVKTKLKKVVQWGTVSWGTGGLVCSFYGCSELTDLPTGAIPDVSAINSVQQMFQGCSKLAAIPSGLFDNCTAIGSSGFIATFYGCTTLTSIPADLFKYCTSVSSYGFYYTFYGCSGLTSIPTDLFRYNTSVSSNGFNGTFYECTGITSVPTDLFRYNTALSDYGFYQTFYGCSNLVTIPTDLFRYNTSLTSSAFSGTFKNCSKLESIPTDLFRYNTSVSSSAFYDTFYGCTTLTSIPADLFKYCTSVSSYGFFATFYGCSGLTSIPTDLFRYNTSVTTWGFYFTFNGCTSLVSIPTDLFRYNTSVDNFTGVFKSCYSLVSIPSNLFKYNTGATSFNTAFSGCNKLTLNRNIFYADGEESTRFLNKSIDFTECFHRASFTGTIGEAPKLWDCDFGTGSPTKTDCFGGSANSLASIYNYCSIPATWGATGAACDILLSSTLTRVDTTTETLLFRIATSSIPAGGTFTCYVSNVEEGIEAEANIVANAKDVDYFYKAIPTVSEGIFYVLIVYENGVTREELTNNAYHYSVDQIDTTIINITGANDRKVLNSPRLSYNHGLCIYDGYLYGSARGAWDGSTIGQSAFKLKADDYTSYSSIKFYSDKTGQTTSLGGSDQIVYCKGFLWFESSMNLYTYIIRMNPSDLDYMIFYIEEMSSWSEPIGTDGDNLYVTTDVNVYKLDIDTMLGSFASYGYDGSAPVALPGGASLGYCAIQQNHPTEDSFSHSIAVDARYIYIAATSGDSDTGYEDGEYMFHLQKINKTTMTTVWDVTIPKCTDDMVQNDQYVFLAPEFLADTALDILGASWGLIAARKSDGHLFYLKALHSDFNTSSELDRRCYGVQYFGQYVAVQLVVSKKTVIVDISYVSSWGASFPIGGATEKIYSFQLDGVAMSSASNELVMDNDGLFHANTWENNTIVYKYTPTDIVLANIPIVESVLIESLIESTTIGGHILSTGGEDITETGFYYSDDPDDLSTHVELETTDIDFTQLLELEPGLYFFKAYASNVNGIGYGSIVPFIVGNTVTLDKDNDDSVISLQHNNSGQSVRCCRMAPGIADGVTGTVQDADGNTYNTIVINEIEWITSDLIAETYADESSVLNLQNDEDWSEDTTGAYSVPT